MKQKLFLLVLCCIVFSLISCNGGTSSSASTTPPVAIGTLPDGAILMATESEVVMNGASTTSVTLYLDGATASESYLVYFNVPTESSYGLTLTVSGESPVIPGLSSLPVDDVCVLGVSDLNSTCKLTFTTIAGVLAGTYPVGVSYVGIGPTMTNVNAPSNHVGTISIVVPAGANSIDGSAITASATDESGNVYVGTLNGNVWAYPHGGSSWFKVGGSAPVNLESSICPIHSLVVHGADDIYTGSTCFGYYINTRFSYVNHFNGQLWSTIADPIYSRTSNIAVDEFESKIYIGSADGIVYSSAIPYESWSASAAVPNSSFIKYIALSSGFLYAATSDAVYDSDSIRLESWMIPVMSSIPNNGSIYAMIVDDAEAIDIGLYPSAQVYTANWGAESWSLVATSLNGIVVTLVPAENEAHGIYAANTTSVWYTTHDASIWQQVSTIFPVASLIVPLALNPNELKIYAGLSNGKVVYASSVPGGSSGWSYLGQ